MSADRGLLGQHARPHPLCAGGVRPDSLAGASPVADLGVELDLTPHTRAETSGRRYDAVLPVAGWAMLTVAALMVVWGIAASMTPGAVQ